MTILVNDQPKTLAEPVALEVLLGELGLAGRKGIAIALNGAVVPRSFWGRQLLADGDKLIVIQATQGG